MRKRRFLLAVVFSLLLLCSCVSTEAAKQFDIHTDLQKAYLQDDWRNFSLYAKGTEELSLSRSFALEVPGGAVLLLSKDPSFGKTLSVSYSGGKAYAANLEIGTEYYYRIVCEKGVLEQGMFTTSSTAPRNMDIDGLTNVRDIAGWTTEDGSIAVQGLVYRSSKFNADESSEAVITAEGIRILMEDLGIKTEIDLRTVSDNENGGITQSPLGEGVRYVSIPMESSGNCLVLKKDKLAELFEVLGNPDAYPIVFHCSIGTDRTGMVAFLLNALLGVGKDDLYRDYLFSNFADIGKMRTKSAIQNYLDAISVYSGDTLAKKTENFLITAGVSEADISSFVTIMRTFCD